MSGGGTGRDRGIFIFIFLASPVVIDEQEALSAITTVHTQHISVVHT